MSDKRLTVNGFDVRLAARRPDGKVLVEFLMPRTGQPMESWAAKHLHEVKGAGSIDHLKQLVRVLPLAEFVADRKPAETPAAERPPETRTEIPWWNKD